MIQFTFEQQQFSFKLLNEYYRIDMNRTIKSNDQLNITMSSEIFDDYDAEWKHQNCGVYLDTEIYEEIALNENWLKNTFSDVPDSLFVRIDAVNPGKNAFQKRIRL
jgi:hypothetical protein